MTVLTPFAIGARVQLQPWVRHRGALGEIVKIGRKYITVQLDDGSLVRQLHPTSLIRSTRRST